MSIRKEAGELRKLWGGFWSSRVLLTANNYRVFDYLESPKTAKEVAKAVGADGRAVEILLDALTGLGLLKKTALRYKNTASSNRFLVKESPYYQGDIIKHADNLWTSWSGLDAVVKTGQPNRFDRKPRDHDAFIRGMHNLAVLKAGEVISVIELKGVKKAIDIGGGPGTYSIEMARKGITVILFDRPETIKIAKGIIRKSGAGNIGFLEGDFQRDAIGTGYDLIFISQVLHSYSDTDNTRMIKKWVGSLNPGGRIVIQEFYLDKNRAYPPQGALFSVNMLVNTTGGRCYAPSEIRQWLSKAGLGNIRNKVMDDTVLVTGTKKAQIKY